jgi:serine/threonine protein kinase
VYYQSPETLLGYRKAAFSADMWAVGCILGSMLVNHEPLFQSGPAPPMNLSVQVDAMAQVEGTSKPFRTVPSPLL